MTDQWKIFYNPKCSKSRQAKELLEEQKIDAQIINYLETPPSQKEMQKIIENSSEKAENFLRKKEKEFSPYKNEDLSQASTVAKIIAETPKLLERPLVMRGNKIVIARPAEKLKTLL